MLYTVTGVTTMRELRNFKKPSFQDIAFNSQYLRQVLFLIHAVAHTDKNVLIIGEDGTKKKDIANLIHENSQRRHRSFISVSVDKFNNNLLEVELFGRECIILTDPVMRTIGKVEQANGGTFFINSIDNLPSSVQSQLLRLLLYKEIVRVGGNEPVRVDVRLIASSKEEPEVIAKQNKIRLDLLYRMDGFRIQIPPLRKCRSDIPEMAKYLVWIYSRAQGKNIRGISEEAVKTLLSYSWPGNICELERAIELAVTNERTDVLTPESLSFLMDHSSDDIIGNSEDVIPLRELERETLMRAMRAMNNNIQKVAKTLGINRTTVYKKIKNLNKHNS